MNCSLYEIPFFGHLKNTFKEVCDTSKTYSISYFTNAKHITILYREAADTGTLSKTNWVHTNHLHDNKYSPKKTFSEFQIFVELDGSDIYFKDIKLVTEEN